MQAEYLGPCIYLTSPLIGVSSGAGTAYPSGAPEFILGF